MRGFLLFIKTIIIFSMKLIKNNFLIILILLLSLGIRLAVTPYGTFGDINAYREWTQRLMTYGMGDFYFTQCIYPPGYIYVLFVVGKIGLTSDFIFKLPSIFSDIITIYLIYFLVMKLLGRRKALITAFIYGISPCIFANTAMWGQADGTANLPTFLSFCFFAGYLAQEKKIRKKIFLIASGLSIGLSFATKPNGIFLLPFFLMAIIFWKKVEIRRVFLESIMFLLPAILLFFVVFVPFTGKKDYFKFVSSVTIESVECHPMTSYAAFNFWRLYKDWSPDNGKAWILTYKEWGRGAFILCTVFILIAFVKKMRQAGGGGKVVFFLAETLVLYYLFWFLFTTGVHERHMFPIFAFLAVAAAFKKSYWIFYFILTIVYTINLGYVSKGIVFNQNNLYTPELLILYPWLLMAVWVIMMIKFLREK